MEISCVKGERILLTDNCSQTFAGVVKSVNTDLGRILLTDIVLLPGKKCIAGYRNFDRDEIIEIKKYEPEECVVNDVNGLPFTYGTNDVNDNIQKEPDKPALKLSESEYNEIKKRQSEFRYIRDFGTNFHSAISLLKTCRTIGVYGRDVSKGRFGRASVLAVSCSSHIFVFDVHALGDDVLHKGLKEVFESPSIVKVVHDCRLLSDCLKHKHLISLENVRDVEAEDIMVVFQERRTIRRHSRSLEYLFKVYLGVEVESLEGSADVWNERPLPPNLLEGLVSFASFLIPLQEAIERKYLQLLIEASNIYNSRVRDLDSFDILYADYKRTLRKELSELLVPQINVRSEYRTKKVF